jgi:hypothetical protein
MGTEPARAGYMGAITETLPLMETGMKNRMPVFLSALALVAVAACTSDDTTTPVNNTVIFKATLTPTAEVPAPNIGTATPAGTFVGTLDTVTNQFTYDISFSGLTSGVTVGHIHGPADPGVATTPILTFSNTAGQQFSTGLTSGTAHGTWTLDANTSINATVKGDSLRKLLFAGKTYANIHTSNNTGGEIRGQITKQ